VPDSTAQAPIRHDPHAADSERLEGRWVDRADEGSVVHFRDIHTLVQQKRGQPDQTLRYTFANGHHLWVDRPDGSATVVPFEYIARDGPAKLVLPAAFPTSTGRKGIKERWLRVLEHHPARAASDIPFAHSLEQTVYELFDEAFGCRTIFIDDREQPTEPFDYELAVDGRMDMTYRKSGRHETLYVVTANDGKQILGPLYDAQ
jgi:hypothetical protein